MKKQLLFVSLLSAGFILSSCNEKPVDSSSKEDSSAASSSKAEDISSVDSSEASDVVSSSEEETISTSTESSEPDDSSSEDEIEYATAWSEEDIADMSTYIKQGYTLPFATGLTTDYINASGELTDGSSAFVVYDYFSGDLSSSYAAILTNNGFTLDYVGDDDGMPYYNYYYELSDETALVQVQFYYAEDIYGDSFNLIAWYQEGGKSVEFPYSNIQAGLGLQITLNTTNLPSFTLAEGEKYDFYPSDDLYCVGGYFDETVSDDDYTSAYETALANAGYTVDSDKGKAINETIALEVEYMAYEGYFFIQVGNYVPVPEPTPGDKTLTLTADNFGSSYGEDLDLTVDNITFKYTNIMKSDTYIQFSNQKKRAGGEIYNTTSMGELKSFVITAATPSYYGELSLYVSSSQISDDNVGTEVKSGYDEDTLTYVYNVPAGNSYFKLVDETDFASKNDSIVINYTIA